MLSCPRLNGSTTPPVTFSSFFFPACTRNGLNELVKQEEGNTPFPLSPLCPQRLTSSVEVSYFIGLCLLMNCSLRHVSCLSFLFLSLCAFLPWWLVTQWSAETCTLFSLLPAREVLFGAVVYCLSFVVQQDNQGVWSEWADEWCSWSRTKRPPLCFIDVLMQLSRLPSESELYTVVGRQMPMDSTEQNYSS